MATISSLKEKIRSPFAKGKENTRKIQLMLEETLTKNVQLQRVNRLNIVKQTNAWWELLSRFKSVISYVPLVSFTLQSFCYENELIYMKMNLQMKHLFMCLVLYKV